MANGQPIGIRWGFAGLVLTVELQSDPGDPSPVVRDCRTFRAVPWGSSTSGLRTRLSASRVRRARPSNGVGRDWLNTLALISTSMIAMVLLVDCTGGQSVMLPSLRSPIHYPSSA